MEHHEGQDTSRQPPVLQGRAPEDSGQATAWIVTILACVGEFMVVLDLSVVNVALPSIQDALGFSAGSLQWVVNGYALVFAGFLLLGGRLADLYGRKRVFVLGLALFSVASLVGGLASAPGMLVAARAVQGLGAAILTPATLTILTTTFAEGPQRTRAVAIWAAVASAGGAVGNILGGGLTEFLSWRWILLVNVPIGALLILLAVLILHADYGISRGHKLDAPGTVVATLGVASLTYGVTQTEILGWSDPVTVSALAIGTIALALFVLVETRFAPTPLMPPRLFRIRAISVGNVAMLLAGACFMPMWYFLTLSMQNVLHYGPLQTGLGFLPHTLVTIVVGARLTPWIMDRIAGRKLILIGALVAAAGFLWQSRITPDSGYLYGILGPAIFISAGVGLLNTPITTTVTSGTSASDAGAASGLMNTAKQVGGVLGLAVLVVVAGTHLPTPSALAAGYGRAFLTIAAVLVLVAAVTLALPSDRDATVESLAKRERGRSPH